ncbi:phosphate ABC transporter ATP-binding protein [Candidatus Bathyarchaeota archaeon]|nr:phosphate ABC transporter ATP-binding protein [Candidatus Bathyarchaeota archaeon]
MIESGGKKTTSTFPEGNSREDHPIPGKDKEASSKKGSRDNVIIKVKDLNLWFGTHHVLHDINLDILERKVTAIIGPSGCGKSTLLRTLDLMNKLVDTCEMKGEVIYQGRNILERPGNIYDIRKRVGMVFQKPNPFPKSIYQNIAYGVHIHKIHRVKDVDEIVEQTLKDAALWEEVKDRLQESALGLSGGQQQRLCIARALAVEPEIILMDEPCSALDPIATSKIEDLINELKRQYTVIIVTHNMQQAARVSDYTAFMYLGKLIEYGETHQIFERPKQELTENYITGRFG